MMQDFTFDLVSERLDEIIEQAPGTVAVAIEHLETRARYRRLADKPFYAASVIKIPIMTAVFDEAHQGRLRLDERIAVTQEDMVTGSGSLQYLTPGLELPISDLVTLMIIESDNTATNLLIDKLGLDTIAASMKEWGLHDTQLHHKLQIIPAKPSAKRNSITASEMTTLLGQMARGQIVSFKACRRMIEVMKWQMFGDGIPLLLPSEDDLIGAIPQWEFAHKTGWVNGIAHDSGLLYLRGHTFAITVCASDFTDRVGIHHSMGLIGRALYDTVYAEGAK